MHDGNPAELLKKVEAVIILTRHIVNNNYTNNRM